MEAIDLAQILKHFPTDAEWEQRLDETYRNMTYRTVIPDSTLETLKAYLYKGVPTSDFLRATLKNDLTQSIGLADQHNLPALPWIIGFIYNNFPVAARDYAEWLRIHRDLVELRKLNPDI